MRNAVWPLAGLLAAVILAAGCSPAGDTAPATSVSAPAAGASAPAAGATAPAGSAVPPQGVQAEAVAEQEFGLLAAGDWGGAWGLWTDSAKQVLSEADYVKLNTECPPGLGVAYVIVQIQRIGTTTVLVLWKRGPASGRNNMLYQNGAWKFAPGVAELDGYRLGVAKLVARRKAEKACH